MVCSTFISPLDLQCIFVNTFTGTGSFTIFGILALITIFVLGGRFRMPNFAVGMVVMLFGIMFFGQIPWILYLGTLLFGIVVALIIRSMTARN